MKSWKYIISAAAAFAFLFTGCGGGGGGDGGTSTPNEESTFTETNAGELMTRIEGLVTGCDYVEDVNASAQYGTVLPAGLIHNIRYSPEFDAIIQSRAARANVPIELNCTTGTITGTVAEDLSLVSIDFNQCNLSENTLQGTTIDGPLNIGITGLATDDLIDIDLNGTDTNLSTIDFDNVVLTASTTGLRVTDTNLSQDITLVLTGFSVNAGAQTAASPVTIALTHVGVTDHVNSSNSFQLDSCSGVAYTNLTGDSVLDPTTCTYTDEDGSFTITSDGGLVLDGMDGTVDGSVTVTATDGTTMVFTFADSTGEVDVNLNGEDFGTLDCTAVDMSELTF